MPGKAASSARKPLERLPVDPGPNDVPLFDEYPNDGWQTTKVVPTIIEKHSTLPPAYGLIPHELIDALAESAETSRGYWMEISLGGLTPNSLRRRLRRLLSYRGLGFKSKVVDGRFLGQAYRK